MLLALTALTAAIGVVTIASHWLPVASSTFEVVVVVGMAVGVDYSLFYLRREREERAAGRSPAEALRIAARTSGRTILISGLTVMAAMSGLFLVGGGPFTGFALGTIAVVGLAVIGSLTVLPGLLAWLGPKADAGQIPFLGRRRAAARPSRFCGRRWPAGWWRGRWCGAASRPSRCSPSPRRPSACGSGSPPPTCPRMPRRSARSTRSSRRSRRPPRRPRSW